MKKQTPKPADPRQRAAFALEQLRRRYPEPPTLLAAHSPWQLLVATVLAAQCTDARVNQVTPALFARWPGPEDLKNADQAELEAVIHSTGFFRNKAKNLRETARLVAERHGGRVPDTMEALTALPGLARKTANIVLWGGYGINAGLAVDTHVKRIAFRLGLTRETDPVKVERDLTALFEQPDWGLVNHLMVWFGRDVCDARKPRCEPCELAPQCPRNGVPAVQAARRISAWNTR